MHGAQTTLFKPTEVHFKFQSRPNHLQRHQNMSECITGKWVKMMWKRQLELKYVTQWKNHVFGDLKQIQKGKWEI